MISDERGEELWSVINTFFPEEVAALNVLVSCKRC
jgi:hypothetical protein